MEAKLEKILQQEELIISLLRSDRKHAVDPDADGSKGGGRPIDLSFARAVTAPALLMCGCGDGNREVIGAGTERKKTSGSMCDTPGWLGKGAAGSLHNLLPPVGAENCSSAQTLFSARVDRSWSIRPPSEAAVEEAAAAHVDKAADWLSTPPSVDGAASIDNEGFCLRPTCPGGKGGSSSSLTTAGAPKAVSGALAPWAARSFFAARLKMSPLAAAAAAATRPPSLLASGLNPPQRPASRPVDISKCQTRSSRAWQEGGGRMAWEMGISLTTTSMPQPSSVSSVSEVPVVHCDSAPESFARICQSGPIVKAIVLPQSTGLVVEHTFNSETSPSPPGDSVPKWKATQPESDVVLKVNGQVEQDPVSYDLDVRAADMYGNERLVQVSVHACIHCTLLLPACIHLKI